MKTDVAIAKILLELGAVTLQPDQPFRYTSGILSPIYTDNRVLISYPAERKKIAKALNTLARQHYQRIEAIAGTATAGITWSAWLAENMNIPMVYVRGKAKEHGQKNQIEGVLAPGAKTLIVDDLISTGGSALNTVAAIRKAGGQPLAVVAIFTYGMASAKASFSDAGVPLHALTTFDVLTDTAVRLGMIGAAAQSEVLAWAENPTDWAKTRKGHDG